MWPRKPKIVLKHVKMSLKHAWEEPKQSIMKGIKHDAYKANKVDYTTPIKTEHGMT